MGDPGNPFDLSFVFPIIVGATSFFLVTNDLFALISAIFSFIILIIALFEKAVAYRSSKPPMGFATISIGFLIFSGAGQAIIYFSGVWPEKMGIFQLSPMLTMVALVLSAIMLLAAEAIRA